ncbi:MAG: carbamoyl-phosphate synthase large subunit [Rickettsiaceae bacterium]
MPKNLDFKTILIIGSGPIIIGQACEFDYSGVQACQVLRRVGYRIVLLNSNPATIMTDKSLADATYIEPMEVDVIKTIVEQEKVDAILPTLGGQTAINLIMELNRSGYLKKHFVQIIGATPEAIEHSEDRARFYKLLKNLELDCPEAKEIRSLKEGILYAEHFGFPLIVRPSYTLGGKGGSIVYNSSQFNKKVIQALEASPIGRASIEESVLGWKEFELEVVRDKKDNCIIVCSIENLDPMGIHTGDSITVAPALTLTDKEYQRMRDMAFKVIRAVGIETGGANVQFAVNPKTGRVIIIEINPRVSRSSALASKATGFPIAKVAAQLAVGYTLDELQNEITQKKCSAFEPTIDYVVIKIPRFDLAKFKGISPELGVSMKSVGEVMALGRTFPESLQKALRSLEQGYEGLSNIQFPTETTIQERQSIIRKKLSKPTNKTIFYIAEAYRLGMTETEIYNLCNWDPWFLRQIERLIHFEEELHGYQVIQDKTLLRNAKSLGFSNKRISYITSASVENINSQLEYFNIKPTFRRVDSCSAEFNTSTAYLYSTYLPFESQNSGCESYPSNNKKVIILGSGPNRIGQAIEFDYCCVHASQAVQEIGYESIMINCNPETVSTDHTVSNKLYFSPLLTEDILDIIYAEQKAGLLLGVLVQFGGQTAIKLAADLEQAGITILGTSVDSIDFVEDRDRFRSLARHFSNQPRNMVAITKQALFTLAEEIGFPVIVRPSYVIGGQFIEILNSTAELTNSHVYKNFDLLKPLLIEEFLENAVELDVDALSDGKDVYIAGILQHFEKAGIHSGDSSCILPAVNISSRIIEGIHSQTIYYGCELNIKGLFNIQFAIREGELYVLEINPRASRTVPFVSKAIDLDLNNIATQIALGKKLKDFQLDKKKPSDFFAIKQPVFSFERLPGVETKLGPEMHSTGEAMFFGRTLEDVIQKSKGNLDALESLPISLQAIHKVVKS